MRRCKKFPDVICAVGLGVALALWEIVTTRLLSYCILGESFNVTGPSARSHAAACVFSVTITSRHDPTVLGCQRGAETSAAP